MSTLLNKPYDAFADEGAEEDVQVEVKKSKTGMLELFARSTEQEKGDNEVARE